jgi:predicted membrane-bound mannosyltransferase
MKPVDWQTAPEITGKPDRRRYYFWAVIGVVALAALLRTWKVSEWSLWQDEETTLYFSQHLDKGFPRASPVYFVVLHGLYQVTGISVTAGRLLAAVIGTASIGLMLLCFRHLLPRRVALVAALLLAINLGHVFWSQSVRYFTTVFLFELLAVYWFLDGFERGRYGSLFLANVALALALLTHFSALLLVRAFGVYLALMIGRRESGGAYHWRGYLAFGLPCVLILVLFAWELQRMQGLLSGMAIPLLRDPLHVGLTALAYFGVPVVGVALLCPFAVRHEPRRIPWFFLIVGLVPVAKLLVLAQLSTVNVTWYYAFIALLGFTVAAAFGLVSLARAGWRRSAFALGSASVLYYGVLLAGYFTLMHGDRPRWQEAAQFLRQNGHVKPGAADNPAVYATVPGTIAFYLGVPPAQTMSDSLVQKAPRHPPERGPEREQWYVLEAIFVTPEYRSWFAKHGTLEAKFEVGSRFRDRSVFVFHCPGSRPKAAPTPEQGPTPDGVMGAGQ